MKISCPNCNQTINLGYLEKTGDQMRRCSKCGVYVGATYKKTEDRIVWEVSFEKPLPKTRIEENGCFLLTAFIVIAILVVLALLWNSD